MGSESVNRLALSLPEGLFTNSCLPLLQCDEACLGLKTAGNSKAHGQFTSTVQIEKTKAPRTNTVK